MTTIDPVTAFGALVIGLAGLALAASILRNAGQKAPVPVKIKVQEAPRRR